MDHFTRFSSVIHSYTDFGIQADKNFEEFNVLLVKDGTFVVLILHYQ